jgi:hypothetical protein
MPVPGDFYPENIKLVDTVQSQAAAPKTLATMGADIPIVVSYFCILEGLDRRISK